MLNQNLMERLNKDKIIEIAKKTGFISRERKITAPDFFFSLVFRSSKQLPVSLRNLAVFFEKTVSRTAVHKKFNEKASLFFKQYLEFILSQKIKNSKINTAYLDYFNKIILVDSSSWNISPELQKVFPGSGGSGSSAGCKIQFLYEYKTGSMNSVAITEGSSPDQKYSKKIPEKIGENDLVIFDLGYWGFDTFSQIEKKGAYYITRLNTSVNLWLKDGENFIALELHNFFKKRIEVSLEFNVYMNKDQKKRLVAFRAPEEVANRRRANLRKNAKKKGRTPSEKSLNMCDWSIFITNCNENILPGEMIRSLYRIRWSIELVFKNWKSILKIQNCNAKSNKNRLLCELYGKLILAVIVHNSYGCLNSYMWNTERKEISFWCLWNFIIDHAQRMHEVIKVSVDKFIFLYNSYMTEVQKNCIKYHQPSRKTTLQQIDEMIGDNVPVKILDIEMLDFSMDFS